MKIREFIKYFITEYGKDYHMDSDLFRKILLDFEEKLEDDDKNK